MNATLVAAREHALKSIKEMPTIEVVKIAGEVAALMPRSRLGRARSPSTAVDARPGTSLVSSGW